jgi:hypothetical protein
MTSYRVTYYTMSDGQNEMIIAAASPAEAEAEARQRDDCFAQLKQVIYIGDNKPMTTPTNQPDKMTAQELRDEFAAIHAQLEALTDTLTTITQGIQHAATATPPAQGGTFSEMVIDCIIMTYDDNGKPAYKATGTPWIKFGVRVWDEVLPLLGIDPASLRPGKNPLLDPIRTRVLMNAPEEGKTAQPRKVTGRI